MKPKERSINYALLSSTTDQQCIIETDRQIIRTFSPITEPLTNTKEVEFPIDLSVKKSSTTTTKQQQQQQIILPSTTIIYDHHNHHGTNFDSFKEYHHKLQQQQQQHTFVDSRHVPQSSIDVDWTSTSSSTTTTRTTSGRYLMNDLLKHNHHHHHHTSAFHQYPITGNLFPYLFIDPLGRSSQIHVKQQQQQQPQPPPPPLPTTLTSSSSSLHSISANIDENIHHHQSNLAQLKSQSTINSTLLLDQYAMPYRLHAAAAAAAATAAKDSVPLSFTPAAARFVDNHHPRHIANGSNHLSNQHYHTHMMHRNARDIHNSSNRIIDHHHLNQNNNRLPLSAESTSSSTSSSPYDYPDYNQADSLKNTIDDNNQQPTTTGTGSSSSPPSSLSSSISIPSPTSTTMLVKNSSSSSSSMVKTNSISNKNDDHYPTNIIKMNGSRIACYYESGDDGSTLSPLSSSFQSCQRQNYLKNFGLRKSLSDPCLSPSSSSSSTTKITFILKNRTLFRSKSESFIMNRLTTATTFSSNDKNFLARKTRIVINKSTNCSSTTLKSTVTTASTISTITAAAATSTKICAPKKLFASNYLLDKLTDNDKHNNISCDQLNCGAQSKSNNASKITAATTTKFYRNYRKEVIECWDNEHRDDGSEIIKQKQINNRPLKSLNSVDDKDDVVVGTKNHKESNGFIQQNKILDLRITANHNDEHGDRLLPLMIVNHNVDDDDDEHIFDSNEQMMFTKSSSMALSSSSSPPSSSTSIKYMDADSNHDHNHHNQDNNNHNHHNYMMTMMMMKTINDNQTNNDGNNQQLDIYKQYYKYLMQCDAATAAASASSASPSPSSFATRAAAAAAAVAETYAKLLSNNNNKCIDNKHVSLSYNQKNINNINDIKTSLIDHHHHNQNHMMITSQNNNNKSFENNGLYETKRNSPDCSQDNVVHQMNNNNIIGKCELRSADTTNGNIIFDRKRISRPLTGKHVRHGTGASPSTLISLRNMIQQRQKLKEIGKFNCTLRYGKSKNNANKRLKHRK